MLKVVSAFRISEYRHFEGQSCFPILQFGKCFHHAIFTEVPEKYKKGFYNECPSSLDVLTNNNRQQSGNWQRSTYTCGTAHVLHSIKNVEDSSQDKMFKYRRYLFEQLVKPKQAPVACP